MLKLLFLNGELHDEIYMERSTYFVKEGQEQSGKAAEIFLRP